jgi:MoaA/NifB/PqqE/SkfB family radical SAM enzyme
MNIPLTFTNKLPNPESQSSLTLRPSQYETAGAVDIIDWKLIGTCNLQCKHCYGPPKTEKALPLDTLLTLVIKFEELGAKWVVLTGGEPLIVLGIDQVIRQLRCSGMKVALSTNTSFFHRHQRTIEDYVSSLNIPLDGSTPEIHAQSRKDQRSYHTFFEVLRYYRDYPQVKPILLRVGTVYSMATSGDFLAMAKVLEPFAEVIDTWKIYELIEHKLQRDLRQPLIHKHGMFEREMKTLIDNTSLAPKIMLAPASSRDQAYFMVNPKGQVVVPTTIQGIMGDVVIGDLLNIPLTEIIEKWKTHIIVDNYYTNHRHYNDEN